MPLVSLNQTIPLFDTYGFRIGNMEISKALALDGVHLVLRAKGTGRRRRFTSARLFARTSMKWARRPSAGFTVLQLIAE